jgi:hypothetical protein
MLDQLACDIEGSQVHDLILTADGFHDLSRRPREILHQQDAFTPTFAAQLCSPSPAASASRRQR